MSRGDLNISRWLEAHSDRSAGLMTLSRNAILADVAGDGDHRLVLTDIKLEKDTRCRLKVYKGTLLVSDQVLPDLPSSIASFYTDEIEPRTPAVAVACRSELLIYKNSKPFFKFNVPSSPIEPLESEIWEKFSQEPIADIPKLVEQLKTIRFGLLTSRTQQLLSLSSIRHEEFIDKHRNSQLTKCAPITCMTTLNKNTPEKMGVGCPVVATEYGNIYILDPQTFTIIHQANTCNIKATPYLINATGLLDVEYRIIIATREDHVCVLRRGWLEGKSIIQTTCNIVDMVVIPGDNFIVLATTDKLLHCYTKRGQRLWSTKMINSVTCLCLIPLHHLSIYLVAVGLRGGPIHLYQGRHPVDFTSAPDTPSSITFGQLGQEEHVMVITTMGGTINFKILKRTADFNVNSQEGQAPPAFQGKPLPLPKRSKLFLEQSLRERENAVDIHQSFQQDLVRLRLTAARAIVQNLSDQSGVGNEKEQIKLSAQVLGLGPKFTLILTLENMNAEKPIVGFSILYHTKPTIYKLSPYLIKIPLIPPNLSYKMETKVTEIINENNDPDFNANNLNDNVQNNIIKVFVLRNGQSQPVVAATINMPTTELMSII